MKPHIIHFLIFLLPALLIPAALPALETAQDLEARINKGLSSGEITYRLTEPADMKSLLGPPQAEKESRDGGMLILECTYPQISILFGKMKDDPAPFTLLEILIDGRKIDIGEEKKIVLRSLRDLAKIDRFWGLQNISLVKLDLRSQAGLIQSLSFDTLTEWPTVDKLPAGFNPVQVLENAKNPGLGIRSLQAQGIDGSGVGIAIIDQPLLLGHIEYTGRLIRYDAAGLLEMPPQMHGSPVASIAVGKNVGVAPKASLTYFAVPMWARDNSPYINALKKIFDLNQTLSASERIRVVSISTGVFKNQPHYAEWKEALEQAERLGIFVVTCDQSALRYGTLSLVPGKNPDDFHSYQPGKYTGDDDQIRIPAAGRTMASHRGNKVYTYDREGGMSWGAPYIAGLAALAFQINPKIAPSDIIRLLTETAARTEAGPIINPAGFIEEIVKKAT
jgi:serine protease AprX